MGENKTVSDINDPNTPERSRKLLAALKFILLISVVAGIPAFLYFHYGPEFFSKDSAYRLVEYLSSHRSISALLIIGMQIAQVIVCVLPGQPIQFAASYMFGIFGGLALSLTGAVIGTFFSFYIARILGRDAVELLFGKDKVDDYSNKINSGKGLMIVLLIYLIPGIPKDLMSYVAGISGVSIRPFMLLANIGRIPGMLGSLLFGYFFSRHNYIAIAVLAVITAVILIICFIYRKKLLALMDELEARDKEIEAKRHG